MVSARTTRTAGPMMMRLDLGDDRRDIGVGLDHGRVHLLAEGMKLLLLLIGRRRARFVGGLQCLLFRGERGIGRDGRIVGLFELGLLGISQEAHAVIVMETARRPAGWRCVR